MKCSCCKGVYHPVTGHRWTALIRLCGPCARGWLGWLKLRTNMMNARIKNKLSGKKISFSDNAVKSIIGDED